MFSFSRSLRQQADVSSSRGWQIMLTFFLVFAPIAMAEPLSFRNALSIALRDSPTLHASRARTDAARQSAIPAGELPDPKLALGIENLPIEGPDRYSLTGDLMTMQRIGLMQEFPNAAKREARAQAATARVALLEDYERVARRTVLRETAQAWLARQTVERQQMLLAELFEENRLFDVAVRAQLANGRGSAADAVMPRQEAVQIAQRRDDLNAKHAQADAQLRRWLGANADHSLVGEAPDWLFSREQLHHRLHQHPELASFAAQARVLNAEVAEAIAAERPGWALEFAYEKRGPDFGDMVMLQVSVELPFFTGSRQQPLIAAKQAEQRALAAEEEAAVLEHAAMLDAELADYQRLQQAEVRINEIALPLADEKVSLTLAAWRAGRGALMDVIAARRERVEIKLNAVASRGERLQAAARLHYSYDDLTAEVVELSSSEPNAKGLSLLGLQP